MSDIYQEIIIEEFQNPQNAGQLKDADIVLYERNSSCGDDVKIFLKLDAAKTKIIDIKWEGNGCAISQAAMSVLSAKIKQEQPLISALKKITKKDVEELLGLEDISMGRVKCLTLGLTALHKDITS
jgi:nitrogen fixation NifU-like protein